MAGSCWKNCTLEYFPSLVRRSSSDICCNFQYNNNNISNEAVKISTSFNSDFSSLDCNCEHYDKTSSSLDHNANAAKQPVNFYKRELPKCCISFCSDEGKRIFQEAVIGPYMNCYFSLASQFRTQDEPAYCGLSTLVMVLNALEVDPNRVWKGPWRWYHENMLDCCVPLAIIEKKGITMDQFSCLAACNMLKTKVTRVDGSSSEETFRKLVKSVTQKTNCILVTSYSRITLQQTGDGHFSPIGGYNVERDMVLIMDTARFKYPPHWVSLSLLFKAMQRLDPSCDLPRGYILLSRNELNPGLLFRLSSYFSPIGLDSRLRYFFESWDNVLSIDLTNVDCVSIDAAEMAVVQIIRLLGLLENGIHLMTAQINAKYAEKVGMKIYTTNVLQLISSSELLPLYCLIRHKFVKNHPAALDEVFLRNELDKKWVDNSENTHLKFIFSSLTVSHFLTILLLSWPFLSYKENSLGFMLNKYTSSQMLRPNVELLFNECSRLKQQLSSMVVYSNKCPTCV